MKQSSLVLFLILPLAFLSCNRGANDPSQSATEEQQLYGAKVALAESDLPQCDSTQVNQLFYVIGSEEFRFCSTTGFVTIDLAGEDGTDGSNGSKGAAGDKGATGTAGNPGTDGTDGNTCTLTEDEDGSKIISCTDGSSDKLEVDDCVLTSVSSDYIITCGDESQKIKSDFDGVDGSEFLSGTTSPLSTLGKNGDTYFDAATSTTYHKANGLWVVEYGAEWDPICATPNTCGLMDDVRETPVRSYKWVKIGTQTWMSENLAYLPYVNLLTESTPIDPMYYVYGNNSYDLDLATSMSIYTDYGVLYNWVAARTACPTGWHLPSEIEWQTLVAFLGTDAADQGKALKAISALWSSITGTNEVGFSAQPGGYFGSGSFLGLRELAVFWSATSLDESNASYRQINDNNDVVSTLPGDYSFGFSVRCLKDSK